MVFAKRSDGSALGELARVHENERLVRFDEMDETFIDFVPVLALRRVTRADSNADLGTTEILLSCERKQFFKRPLQVALNVVGECAQRRHIDDICLVAQFPGQGQSQQTIET